MRGLNGGAGGNAVLCTPTKRKRDLLLFALGFPIPRAGVAVAFGFDLAGDGIASELARILGRHLVALELAGDVKAQVAYEHLIRNGRSPLSLILAARAQFPPNRAAP